MPEETLQIIAAIEADPYLEFDGESHILAPVDYDVSHLEIDGAILYLESEEDGQYRYEIIEQIADTDELGPERRLSGAERREDQHVSKVNYNMMLRTLDDKFAEIKEREEEIDLKIADFDERFGKIVDFLKSRGEALERATSDIE